MVYCKFLLISVLFAFAAATEVRQCSGKSFENLSKNVQVESCSKPPCQLETGTEPEFSITFTPKTNLEQLTTRVSGTRFGVSLPFIGVDGISACDKLETESGDPTACPLKAGKTYVYKNSFEIKDAYPNGEYDVHWALTSRGEDVICFDVAVNIV